MIHDDDEDDEIFDSALFDTSDVEVYLKPTKARKEVTLIMKSETDFNLVKMYLALKDYVEQMEQSMNIFESTGDTH